MYPKTHPKQSSSLDRKSSLEAPPSFHSSSSDDDSTDTLLGHPHPKPTSSRRRTLLATFLAFISLTTLTLLLYTSFTVHRLSSASPLATSYGDCGASETVEEARAKGCVFDAMSWIWVRPECYDAELVEDFFENTNYTWHTEPKLKPETKVPMEVVRRGDHPKLFVQKEYHSVHCAVSINRRT